jgi:hypothetical protein
MRQNAMAGAILSLTLLSTGTATAQNPQATSPQTAAPQNPTVPVPPRNSPSTPPERIAPPDESGNLSRQLPQDRGTLKPPSVDPGMTVKPPRKGTTPVIPPPGSPGGDQSVVPK